MFQYPLRAVKRFAVLLPGIIIAYVSVRNIFPLVDKRLPLALAIFVTYVVGAYVLTPALIRLYRVIVPADHLPLYCITPDGFASDPVNVGVIGTRKELITAMEAAGWHVADPHNLKNVAREAVSLLLGRTYPNCPVSSLYLFGRKQDIAFEIPIGSDIGSRHHVRFWATTYSEKQRLSVHTIQWQHRREHINSDRLLWVGAASLDVGLSVIRHNLQISHMIHPDTDRERGLIIDQLKAAKLIKKIRWIKLGDPYRLSNRVLRGRLHSDGRMAVVNLAKVRSATTS